MLIDFAVVDAPLGDGWAILAVSAITDQGHSVTLGSTKGAIKMKDGSEVPVLRRNDVYEVGARSLMTMTDVEQETPGEGGVPAEGVKAKVMVSPVKPTASEVATHEATHIPHRSWCLYCMRARGRPRRHRAVTDHEGVPRLSIDYLFTGQKADEKPMTVLALKDEFRGAVRATAVPAKGTQQSAYPVKWLAECIRMSSYGEVVLKSDGEPAILDLKQRVKADLQTEVQIHLQESPVGDSQANGAIEVTNRVVEEGLRCWKGVLDEKIGVVATTHPLVPWLVQYVGWLITNYAVGDDGRTATQRMIGRQSRLPLVCFGEKVL